MASRVQLLALHRRLAEEQRKLIEQAAAADTIPTRSALSQIADFEQVMLAVETVIDERDPQELERGATERLGLDQ